MIKLLFLAVVAGLVIETEQHEFQGSFFSTADLISESLHDNEDEHDFVGQMTPQIMAHPSEPLGACNYDKSTYCWTEWFNVDDPCYSADREHVDDIRERHPGKLCPNPLNIEVMTTSGLTLSETGNIPNIYNANEGFVCKNDQQPDGLICADYKVRFLCHPPFCASEVCWTPWFDTDNPCGKGDFENIGKLRKTYRGVICKNPMKIEAVTVDTSTPADDTGDHFAAFSPTKGFVCRNEDQDGHNCRDYKVRFGCPCKYVISYW